MHKPRDNPTLTDRDIPVGKIMLAGIAIALFIALTFAGIRLLFVYLDRPRDGEQAAAAQASQRILPPEPRLLVDEPRTWQQELAIQNSRLEGYAWVDRKAGVVRIPVERAMERVAEKGLPARRSGK